MEQINAGNDCVLLGTSWEEFSSLVRDSLMVLRDNQPIPLPRPPDPAGLELNTQPQPLPEPSQFGGYGPCHPGAYSQAQYLPCEWPANGGPLPAAPAVSHPAAALSHTYLPYEWPVIGGPLPTAPAVSHPAAAAPSHTYHNGPVVRLPEGLECVGMMNGEPLYALPAGVFPPPSVPAAPQQSTSNSNKRKTESEPEDDRPYVKRPPNAFMLFVKEHRPHVEEDIKKKGNGAVNIVLGQRWKSLSEEQQAIYLQQANRERELHALRNPGWSVSQNYGKKRKKERGRAPKGLDLTESCGGATPPSYSPDPVIDHTWRQPWCSCHRHRLQ